MTMFCMKILYNSSFDMKAVIFQLRCGLINLLVNAIFRKEIRIPIMVLIRVMIESGNDGMI
jgi:hypothetical protein